MNSLLWPHAGDDIGKDSDAGRSGREEKGTTEGEIAAVNINSSMDMVLVDSRELMMGQGASVYHKFMGFQESD